MRRRGTALVSIVMVFAVVTMMAYSFLTVTVESAKQVDLQRDVNRLESAAESAISLGVQEIWSGYLDQQGGSTGSLNSFRQYLNGMGIDAQGLDISELLNLPAGGATAAGLAGVNVISLVASRIDDASSTQLDLTVTVGSRRGDHVGDPPVQRTMRQAFVVDAGDWTGLDYALLANNINCIMCHAEISSAGLFYSGANDGSKHDRIRVGSLENLLIRSGAESTIAGTLYVRGVATDKSGLPITDWSAQTLYGNAFDADGKIIQDAWGNPTVVGLVPADAADPQPLENLYLDYSQDQASMVDGYLPESFPPPFPDDGGYDPDLGGPDPLAAGNRMVDAIEFDMVAASSQGSLAGGMITLNDGSDPIDTPSELFSALNTGNVASLGGSTTGNVVLIGTESDPIVIDGDVAINGDLVIQGVIRGEGSIMVSGNIYVPADLTYLDGTDTYGDRTFGVADDGSTNSLAMAAGGSVVVGDLWYAKPNKKTGVSPVVTGDESGAANFVISEMGLFNRAEWTKTQPVLPGKGESLSDPSTWTAVNPLYEPGYFPRYYALNEGGSIPFFLIDNGKKTTYFDPSSGTWVGKEHGGWTNFTAHPDDPNDPFLFDSSGAPIAAVHYLTAGGSWIDEQLLHQLMTDSLAARPAGTPVEIDALLYSNNSIYGLAGKSTSAAGQMIVNGAIVAPDVGLLVPGNGGTGLYLNYDERLKNSLQLKSSESITLRPKLWMTVGSAAP